MHRCVEPQQWRGPGGPGIFVCAVDVSTCVTDRVMRPEPKACALKSFALHDLI